MAKDGDSEATTSYEFAKADITSADGKTTTCGINVSDYSNAAAGDYTDTITWTAEATKSVAQTATIHSVLEVGAEFRITTTKSGSAYVAAFTSTDAFVSGNLWDGIVATSYTVNGTAQSTSDVTIMYFDGQNFYYQCGGLTGGMNFVDYNDGTGSWISNDEAASLTKFEVKPAGGTDFVDITSTLRKW